MITSTLFFATDYKKFISKLLLAFIVLVPAAPISFAASFDCNIASRPIEKTICADPELSSLDEKLNQSYQIALAKNPEIKFSQREWLKALNECNVDASPTECLRKAFKMRIRTLSLVAMPSSGTLGIEILGLYKINNQNGLQVGAVTPNSSGYNAGILPGDFIVEVNNSKIEDINQVMHQLSIPPGQTVLLKIVKKDNSERVIQVKMGSKTDAPAQAEPESGAPAVPASIEPPPPEKGDANPKNEPITDSKNSGGSTWFIILLMLIGGYYYWKKKRGQQTSTQPEQNANYGVNESRASTRQTEARMEKEKAVKEPPSKEELLKQQQMNAFKKLK